MSETRHTPPSWRLRLGETGRNWYVMGTVGGEEQCIAAVTLRRGPPDAGGVRHTDPEIQAADAHLIGAAPDLLAALEDIIRADDAEELEQCLIEAARSVVARARGETP